jgi:hypothetical protein
MPQLFFLLAPEGRKNIAQGVSPGRQSQNRIPAPEGRKNLQTAPFYRPSGALGEAYASVPFPRLAPWARSLRPSGAEDDFTVGKFV